MKFKEAAGVLVFTISLPMVIVGFVWGFFLYGIVVGVELYEDFVDWLGYSIDEEDLDEAE